MNIPIRNLYFMLAYAWDALDILDHAELGIESFPTSQDLLARVFCYGLQTISHKGLEKDYLECINETCNPSGRFDVHRSIVEYPRLAGRVVVVEDEYTEDSHANRILLATATSLLDDGWLTEVSREEIRRFIPLFSRVRKIPLSRLRFDQVRYHRNNLHYKLALNVAEIVKHRKQFSAGGDGTQLGLSFDVRKLMWKVFENFVRKLLEIERKDYRVGSPTIYWQEISGDEDSVRMIPSLHPDIVVRCREHILIIDTKFYKSALEKYRKETVKSSHLYQLHSYLTNFSKYYKQTVDGIMLYPRVDRDVDVQVEVQGRKMRFITIDLNKEWGDIKGRLLDIADEYMRILQQSVA